MYDITQSCSYKAISILAKKLSNCLPRTKEAKEILTEVDKSLEMLKEEVSSFCNKLSSKIRANEIELNNVHCTNFNLTKRPNEMKKQLETIGNTVRACNDRIATFRSKITKQNKTIEQLNRQIKNQQSKLNNIHKRSENPITKQAEIIADYPACDIKKSKDYEIINLLIGELSIRAGGKQPETGIVYELEKLFNKIVSEASTSIAGVLLDKAQVNNELSLCKKINTNIQDKIQELTTKNDKLSEELSYAYRSAENKAYKLTETYTDAELKRMLNKHTKECIKNKRAERISAYYNDYSKNDDDCDTQKEIREDLACIMENLFARSAFLVWMFENKEHKSAIKNFTSNFRISPEQTLEIAALWNCGYKTMAITLFRRIGCALKADYIKYADCERIVENFGSAAWEVLGEYLPIDEELHKNT